MTRELPKKIPIMHRTRKQMLKTSFLANPVLMLYLVRNIMVNEND